VCLFLILTHVGIDSTTYGHLIRIYGENLKTDYAKIWFDTKFQPSFRASADGTYIDAYAPVHPLTNGLSEEKVSVRIQINEDEAIYSNSVTVTYFSLDITKIIVK